MFNVKQTTKKISYKVRRSYLTFNSVGLLVLFIAAPVLMYNTILAMERNYTLQSTLRAKERDKKVKELELANARYNKEYYESAEYQEVSQRTYFSKGLPGEKLLLLPKNTQKATQIEQKYSEKQPQSKNAKQSNAQQWFDFISGNRARRLQER